MPVPENPEVPEFYVYVLSLRGVPFYVGIGRSSRDTNRIDFVSSLLRREESGLPVAPQKWVLSNRVVAEFIRRGYGQDISIQRVHSALARAEALQLERPEIHKLASAGFVLANIVHNPKRPRTVSEIVDFVLSHPRAAI